MTQNLSGRFLGELPLKVQIFQFEICEYSHFYWEGRYTCLLKGFKDL